MTLDNNLRAASAGRARDDANGSRGLDLSLRRSPGSAVVLGERRDDGAVGAVTLALRRTRTRAFRAATSRLVGREPRPLMLLEQAAQFRDLCPQGSLCGVHGSLDSVVPADGSPPIVSPVADYLCRRDLFGIATAAGAAASTDV